MSAIRTRRLPTATPVVSLGAQRRFHLLVSTRISSLSLRGRSLLLKVVCGLLHLSHLPLLILLVKLKGFFITSMMSPARIMAAHLVGTRLNRLITGILFRRMTLSSRLALAFRLTLTAERQSLLLAKLLRGIPTLKWQIQTQAVSHGREMSRPLT